MSRRKTNDGDGRGTKAACELHSQNSGTALGSQQLTPVLTIASV